MVYRIAHFVFSFLVMLVLIWASIVICALVAIPA